MKFSSSAAEYFFNLKEEKSLPGGVESLNPYKDPAVRLAVEEFFFKYFNDADPRVFLMGINPGRFGGGITGIAFTDPMVLESKLGIKNNFVKRPELSSRFIYSVIERYGGPRLFYSKFYLTAAYPLALIKNGKNYNFYDDKSLFSVLRPALLRSLREQAAFGCQRGILICLGKRNAEFISALNKETKLFGRIITLEHPRYIMQYRRKYMEDHIGAYINTLTQSLTF